MTYSVIGWNKTDFTQSVLTANRSVFDGPVEPDRLLNKALPTFHTLSVFNSTFCYFWGKYGELVPCKKIMHYMRHV